LPAGGVALALGGWRLYLAVGANFVFGALMSVGIGLYAPCMIMLALLGMHPLAAFPIMMGSCGLVQPAAGLRFFATNRFAWGPTIGLTVGGVAGVLIAAFVVKRLPVGPQDPQCSLMCGSVRRVINRASVSSAIFAKPCSAYSCAL
jgi:hypothetical protein